MDWRIDRHVRGLGRVRLSTQAENAREHRARLSLFDQLIHQGYPEIVRALVDGTLTWPELLEDERKVGLFGLAVRLEARLTLRRNLWEVVDAVFDPRSIGNRYPRATLDELRDLCGLEMDATVESLGDVDWTRLARSWGGTAIDWNHLRETVREFIRLLPGQCGFFWDSRLSPFFPVLKVPPPPLADGLPDVETLGRVVDAAPKRDQDHLRALLFTGMRLPEYERFTADWLRPGNVLRVEGAREEETRDLVVDPRLWPTLEAVAPLAKDLRERERIGAGLLKGCEAVGMRSLRLIDLRRLFQRMCADAKIPTDMVHFALGRWPGYIRPDTRAPWTRDDAGRFADYVAPLIRPSAKPRPRSLE